MLELLQTGYSYYNDGYSAAPMGFSTMGAYLLMIVIGIIGFVVQARLKSVFEKYSQVASPQNMTGAEAAEKMLRENNIHNVKVTHVEGHLTDHFNPQTMTVNLSDS